MMNSSSKTTFVNKRISSDFHIGSTRKTNDVSFRNNVFVRNIDQNHRSAPHFEGAAHKFSNMNNFMDISFMKNFISKGPNEILLTILDDRNKFISIFSEKIERDLMAYTLIAVGKAISVYMNQHVNSIVYKITNSENFLNSISKYLASFQKKHTEQIHLDSLVSLTDLTYKFQTYFPSSASDALIILMPLLKKTCEIYLASFKEVYDQTSEVLKEIEKQNDLYLKQFSPAETQKLSSKEKLQLEEPPENFRSISILPHAEDFRSTSAFIRDGKNVVNGRYQDTEHYLDVQFRLLREDYIRELRDGVAEYKELKKSGKPLKNIKNVRVYTDVCIVSQQVVSSGVIHIAEFGDRSFKCIRWEYSKRLMSGSLLCLSDDHFENMFFATVAERKIDQLMESKLLLRFEELTDEVLSITPSRKFVLIETTAYFEAYRHNLKVLQELDEKKLPMKQYIVEVEKEALKPKYLNASTTYDMRPLLIPLDRKLIDILNGDAKYNFPANINPQLQNIPVLNKNLWPTSRELNFDSSQYDALKAAITKEFAIIQGPPGTGKTYIGLRIVQLLLHNFTKWSNNDESSTILVVCYTNHALDQFLEGLTLFTQNIVRFGGRCQNDALQKYQLDNLRKTMEDQNTVPRYIHSNICQITSELKEMIDTINILNESEKKANQSILSEINLRKFISYEHFRILTSKRFENRSNLMHMWLGINCADFEDFEFTIKESCISKGDLSYDMHRQKIININPKSMTKGNTNELIELRERNFYFQTIAVTVTEILNTCDPLLEKFARRIQNVWELDIISRWKLYKYWILCFYKSKKREYAILQNKLKIDSEFQGTLTRFERKHTYDRQELLDRLEIINDDIESFSFNLLSDSEFNKHIPAEHYTSLKENGINVWYGFPVIFYWLQLKIENQSMMNERVSLIQNLKSILFSLQGKQRMDYTDVNILREDELFADVEYIEAQRNFNSNEYSDVSFNVSTQGERNDRSYASSSNGWQIQGGKKALRELIKSNLLKSAVMSEEEVNYVKNLWKIPNNKRWELYKYWIQCYIKNNQDEKHKLLRSFRKKYKELCEVRSMKDIHIAKNARVVGITTTGAAKYKHVIESLNPVIVIVEEAAEILESHIVTSISSSTQHVILIGDHQQLRPSPTVHMLAVKYDLNVSLFERMIKNGLVCQRLNLQHRMRPEIAALLVPHIYKNLENHKSVSEFENIRGVSNNVYFISHDFNELQENDSKSRVNQHEATFLIELCKYFLHQNYEPSQITILTTYAGQMFELKRLAIGKLENIRITVVDNFQGEENEIILVSFVRSNETGEIGFLKISNRVCVALSRARKGLYCIGNFKLLAEMSNLWRNISSILENKKLIGKSLELKCQNHPSTLNLVKNYKDFESFPDGGCSLNCEYRLSCGHICPLKCHPFDKDHEEINCLKPCIKLCENGHLCEKKCYMDCDSCLVIISKILTPCNHEITIECYREKIEIFCPKPCEKFLPCNHRCLNTCGEDCTKECHEMCTFVSPYCGHIIEVECLFSKDADFLKKICLEPCNKLLPCTHICKGSCGKCLQGLSHVKCDEKCIKMLACGHKCKLLCGEECGYCHLTVTKKLELCGHEVRAKCYLPEEKINCSNPCEKLLSCGHRCLELCGANCTELCEEKCIIKSEYCGHELFDTCHLRSDIAYLTNKCYAPCNAKLACKHTCNGTCGSCHQGRYHVPCNKRCEKILICGHECLSVCSKSCPPCQQSCRNWCDHGKCLKICSDPCEICSEPCTWVCSHKRCTRMCSEQCDRIPCNEPCQKLLECKHSCIGFCGEPCPKLCKICNFDNKIFLESIDFQCSLNDKKYVSLEDCGHVFDLETLDNIFNKEDTKFILLQMKRCPECGTTIKRNNRFGNLIKLHLTGVEVIKSLYSNEYMNKYKKRLASNILNEMKKNSEISQYTKYFMEVLKSKRLRSIQEILIMKKIFTMIQIFITFKGMFSNIFDKKKVSDCNINKVRSYVSATILWITPILYDDYITASDLQIYELCWEIHRFKLAYRFLKIYFKYYDDDDFKTSWADLLKCVLTYSPFRKLELEKFTSLSIPLIKKYEEITESYFEKKNLTSVIGFSVGKFLKCLKGHMWQLSETTDFEIYECLCTRCESE